MRKLPRQFYNRDTIVVARELLGKYLVHRERWGALLRRKRISPARPCRALSARTYETQRGHVWPAGHTYVYMIYGMYFCMNVVTEPAGHASAVLLRALEPVAGLTDKTSGPGLLCNAMKIDHRLNGQDLLSDDSISRTEACRVGS